MNWRLAELPVARGIRGRSLSLHLPFKTTGDLLWNRNHKTRLLMNASTFNAVACRGKSTAFLRLATRTASVPFTYADVGKIGGSLCCNTCPISTAKAE